MPATKGALEPWRRDALNIAHLIEELSRELPDPLVGDTVVVSRADRDAIRFRREAGSLYEPEHRPTFRAQRAYRAYASRIKKLTDRVQKLTEYVDGELTRPLSSWLYDLIEETRAEIQPPEPINPLWERLCPRRYAWSSKLCEPWRRLANTYRNAGASTGRGTAQASRRDTGKQVARGAAKRTRRRLPRTNLTEREEQALALRRQRYTFAQIGGELGVSKQRAQQLVKAAVRRRPATHGRSVTTQALPLDHRGQPLIEDPRDTESA